MTLYLRVHNKKGDCLYTSINVDKNMIISEYYNDYLCGDSNDDVHLTIDKVEITEFHGEKLTTKLKDIPYIKKYLDKGISTKIPITISILQSHKS